MKAIIYRKETSENRVYRTAIYIFGIRVFVWESPDESERPRKPIGFVQFPNDAPSWIEDEDYFPDEE